MSEWIGAITFLGGMLIGGGLVIISIWVTGRRR